MFNQNRHLPTHSETDLSSASDNDSIIASQLSTTKKHTLHKNDQSSKVNCCLICSILPALSATNCCEKHLTLLTTTFPPALPAQIIYMMPPTAQNCSEVACHHCRSSCKRHDRSRCSSTSSSSSSSRQRQENQRSMNVQLSSAIQKNNHSMLSSNMERTASLDGERRQSTNVHRQRQSNNIQTSLLQSFQSSSTINTNINNNNNSSRRCNRILSTSILTRSKRRNLSGKDSVMQNKSVQTNSQQANNRSTSPELIELDPCLSYSPRLLLKRIVNVNGEDAVPIARRSQETLNMTQATDQMLTQKHARPKILLKRIRLDS